ncbi:MAG: isopentenyl phosphate kinase [Thermoplasmata archaeon]
MAENAAGPGLPLAVIKLGGSVITRKREIEKLRPKVLARLSEELAAVKSHRVILLHGAGGFGHPGAVRFGLASPPAPEISAAARARGAAIVSAEVRRLHLAVLRSLVAAGARPWSVPMSTHTVQAAGELETIDLAPFSAALRSGWMPVSFGDVTHDRAWGSSILSADMIALRLAESLHPDRVVFVSDVPGVYAPRTAGRRSVLGAITDEVYRSLDAEPGAPDVTGGIRGKVGVMRAIARFGVNAGLISGLSDGALSRALTGAMNDGSWARAEPR